jgi:FkbM family methyltransferase
MNLRVRLIRFSGIKILDGNKTLTNLAVTKVLTSLKIQRDSQTYIYLRRIYRKTGKVHKIEISHSSFGEDRVLAKYLPELDGRYVDVGAGAPVNGSNTYLFYERGWRGTILDPIHSLVQSHKRRRPRDNQIQACVGNRDGKKVEFFEYLADDFSTNSRGRVEQLFSEGIKPHKSYLSDVIHLRELNFICNPLTPSLLNIDVEGSEMDVLQSNDWDVCKPRVIAVEEWVSPIYVKTEVRKYLELMDYELTSRCFLTSIYVHKLYLETSTNRDDEKLVNNQE